MPCKAARSVAALHRAQADVDQRLINVVDTGGLERIVHVHRGERIQHERLDRLLLHLFQHQIHHRGQAHGMLSATSVAPPQLDEFFSVAEAPLREAEFRELGWTEQTVWGDQTGSVSSA